MKRIFDLVFSILGLLLLSPLFVVLFFVIRLTSRGPAIFKQTRVGRNNKDFTLFKFRTMYLDSEASGQLTVGMRDSRITPAGFWLRKYKLDELPQLVNVFLGDMSFVGPRPEVRKYVNLYSGEQMQVLLVRPGITDYASIRYIHENELLAKATDPDHEYIHHIMPDKLALNLTYIRNRNLFMDIKIILETVFRIGGLTEKK